MQQPYQLNTCILFNIMVILIHYLCNNSNPKHLHFITYMLSVN